jgi:hypothetical protein
MAYTHIYARQVHNAGVVAFTFEMGDGKSSYRIDPDSITEVYKGFDVKAGKPEKGGKAV